MIEVGKTYVLFGYVDYDNKYNNCEVKVIEILGKPGVLRECMVEVVKSNSQFNTQIGQHLWPDSSHMKSIESIKPHEYSPVFMTGWYRTVGD